MTLIMGSRTERNGKGRDGERMVDSGKYGPQNIYTCQLMIQCCRSFPRPPHFPHSHLTIAIIHGLIHLHMHYVHRAIRALYISILAWLCLYALHTHSDI